MGKRKDTLSMESNTRLLRREPEIEPQYLLFTRKIGGELEGVDEYMTYHPELEKILMLDCIRPYRNNGYLKFIVVTDGAETRFTIYDLALGCYMGRIHFDTYLEDIQRFLEEKRFHGYVIDHADNIITNHTIYNLSLMTGNENKQKMDIVAKVKLPSRLSVAYVNGKYRLCMGTEVRNFHGIGKVFSELGMSVAPDVAATAVVPFLCEDPESLAKCLKYLSANTIAGCVPIKTEQGQWRKDGKCWFEDIKRSLDSQRIIAQMDESQFNVFNAKNS